MDLLNNFHEGADGVRTCVNYLSRISASLHFIGNEQLATRIDDELEAILFYLGHMETAVSQMIHQAFSGILDAIDDEE